MQHTRMYAISRLAAKTAFAAAACAAALVPSVAEAQLSKVSTSGSLRLGAYIPTSSDSQRQFGKVFFDGGLDYYFQQNGIAERSLVSVDYFERSSGGARLQVVPVTIGQQFISPARAEGIRPYFGYGVGVYFIDVQDPNDTNLTGAPNSGANNDSSSSQVFGGYGAVGLDVSKNLFFDARYHIISSYRSINPDGLELTAGLRF